MSHLRVDDLAAPQLTGRLLRAARAMAGLSAAELARRSGVGERTIKRAEANEGVTRLSELSSSRLLTTLNTLSVRLVDIEGVGVAVLLSG